VVGDANSVTVGAVCATTAGANTAESSADREIAFASLLSTTLGLGLGLEVDGRAAAAFTSAVAAAALLTGVEEPAEQAVSAMTAALGRTQREQHEARSAINPLW